jgi:hypothetical protein
LRLIWPAVGARGWRGTSTDCPSSNVNATTDSTAEFYFIQRQRIHESAQSFRRVEDYANRDWKSLQPLAKLVLMRNADLAWATHRFFEPCLAAK